MKRNLLRLLSATSVLMLVLAGCSGSKEPLVTNAVAYPLSADQLKVQNLSVATGFYAENVLPYVNASNETVLRIYSAPIEDSENILTLDSGGGYVGDGKFIKKALPKNWSLDNQIRIAHGANYAEITPAIPGEYASEQKTAINIFGQSCDTVVYKDAFGKGTDLNCSVTIFGVNLEINFQKRPEQNIYQIKIKLPDLVPDTGSPDYILFKTALEKGEVKIILESPLAADKNGQWSYANSVRLIEKDSTTGTYTVEYTIDEAFLADASTKYPVRNSFFIKSETADSNLIFPSGDGGLFSPYLEVVLSE